METDRRPGDPPYLIACSDKAQKKLDWKLQYSLEDIIITAWNWHQIMAGRKLV